MSNGNDSSARFKQTEKSAHNSRQLENIKQVLGDINKLFVKFGEIVATQQLMVERIDADTEMALLDVERGKGELSEHFENVSSYKSLMLKVLLIVIFFATVYIVFVV